MTALQPCPGCARHVRERVCPFCGGDVPLAAPRPAFTGRVTRAAVFTALAGCWTNTTPAEQHTTPEPEHHGDATPAATGAIEGIITDTRGPIEGVDVSLDGRTGATTDYAGRFRFDGVALGTHQVTIHTLGNHNHGGGRFAQLSVVVQRHRVARADAQLADPDFDPSMIPKPYGAPPARRRIV